MSSAHTRPLIITAIVTIILLAISGYTPYDRATWLMEVAPIFIAMPVLFLTYRNFPLTSLLYALIFVHACILMIGGAYSYARVPLGFDIAHFFGWTRNPYDKSVHSFQE